MQALGSANGRRAATLVGDAFKEDTAIGAVGIATEPLGEFGILVVPREVFPTGAQVTRQGRPEANCQTYVCTPG